MCEENPDGIFLPDPVYGFFLERARLTFNSSGATNFSRRRVVLFFKFSLSESCTISSCAAHHVVAEPKFGL
jgi:hypothetical protein